MSAGTNRAPLPEGTFPVGAGLLVAGLSSFAFFKLGQVALGKELFKPIMALWFVAFTLVPGFFIPVEQELGRSLAHRRALGQGGRQVVSRVIALSVGLGGALLLAVLAASAWLTTHMFEGYAIVTFALLLTIVAYAVAHVGRGIASGSARFAAYGLILGADSAIRIAACLVLWLAGVDTVGPYALTVALSPLAAVLIVAARRDLVTHDGPPVELSDVTPNLGWLLVGSMMSAALVNAGPLGVDVLAGGTEAEKVTAFGNGVILARIPLFLFQAIQASLLPRLAKLAAEGDMDEFRAGFRRLMVVVATVAVVGTLGAFAVGPQVLDIMYEGGLDRRTLGLLAMSSGLFMLAQAVAQAVIALHGHKFVALSWLTGATLFVVVTAFVSDDLYLRVEVGLVVSCAATFVALLASLRARINAGAVPDAESMIDGVFDNPVEG